MITSMPILPANRRQSPSCELFFFALQTVFLFLCIVINLQSIKEHLDAGV